MRVVSTHSFRFRLDKNCEYLYILVVKVSSAVTPALMVNCSLHQP